MKTDERDTLAASILPPKPLDKPVYNDELGPTDARSAQLRSHKSVNGINYIDWEYKDPCNPFNWPMYNFAFGLRK